MKIFKKWLGTSDLETPEDLQISFDLLVGSLVVGKLSLADGEWTFRYSESFKEQEDPPVPGGLRPIIEFPVLEKVYRSTQLWPFFAMRIPSLSQDLVQESVKETAASGGKDLDEVGLLKQFGKRSIANPFELIAP
jgi:hypothetical protein